MHAVSFQDLQLPLFRQDFLKTLQAGLVFVTLCFRAGAVLLILLCFLCVLRVAARSSGLQ